MMTSVTISLIAKIQLLPDRPLSRSIFTNNRRPEGGRRLWSEPTSPDEMPLLNCGKSSCTGHDGNRDKGPKHHRHGEEEQETCQFVGRGMREAEIFANNQCRDLIDKLNHNDSSRPNPQPSRNLDNGYYPYRAASDETDIRHTVQDSTGFALSMQFSCKETIYHVAQAT